MLLCLGCSRADYDGTEFQCESGACPEGFSCVENVCVDGELDADAGPTAMDDSGDAPEPIADAGADAAEQGDIDASVEPVALVENALYGVFDEGGFALVRFDTSTMTIVETVAFPELAEYTGGIGLATEPQTGRLYTLLRKQVSILPKIEERTLAFIDPSTRTVHSVGVLSRTVSTLAFDGDGTLYGVTGQIDAVPETLVSIDITTAQVTPIGAGPIPASPSRGTADGQALARDTDSGVMYRVSGSAPSELQRLDVGNATGPEVPGYVATSEPVSATYWSEQSVLLLVTQPNQIARVSLDGAVEPIIALDGDSYVKGIAFTQ